MNNLIWIPSAIPFFLFGFFYYLITPFISLYFFADNPILLAAHNYIDISFFDTRYFLDCLLIIFSWLIGYNLIQKIKYNQSSLDKIIKFKISPFILGFTLLFFLFFLVISAKAKGTVFFSGYSNYDISVLGPFATMLFISVWFINYFERKIVKILFIIIFLFSSVLMLGLGSRMFFVLGIISLILATLSTNKKILNSPLFYIFLFGLLALVIGVGIWRSNAEFSFELFISIFLAEPLFTSTSGAMYFENIGGRPLIGFPTDILASFINFIPTIIFPEKIELLKELTYDPNKYSPFGANAIMVNIYSNFGIFFPIYFFSIGLFYGYLRKKAKCFKFYRATYFSILPLLMFHFFREGFITVIKVLFFNALILPFIIVIFIIFIFHRKLNVGRGSFV